MGRAVAVATIAAVPPLAAAATKEEEEVKLWWTITGRGEALAVTADPPVTPASPTVHLISPLFSPPFPFLLHLLFFFSKIKFYIC